MHIPDGYLSPQTYVPLYGVSFLFWYIALKKIKEELPLKYMPYLAMAAAFSFLIQMFNIPIPGGTTGHVIGGSIIAILLGPWTAVIAVSVVVMIQTVVFGMGGITALGANCFNMAVVMPFVSYWVFKVIKGSGENTKRLHLAAFMAGYIGLTASAIMAAFQFGIQPIIASDAAGTPLYAPYPLEIALPVIAFGHLFLFSIIEGMITVMLLMYFLKNEPEVVYALRKG